MGRVVRTERKRALFLQALLDSGGVVTVAAKKAAIGLRTAYDWREADAGFAKDWDDVVEQSTALLEAEAIRRAWKGTLKPIFQGGRKVGSVREYSDTLLIFALKARKPTVYRDRVSVDHSGRVDGTAELNDIDRAGRLLAILAGAAAAVAGQGTAGADTGVGTDSGERSTAGVRK
ncbi:MAG: terminase [Burkholderiales bacterium]|nr:terminase [Burkholderiales bacterium]